LQAENKINVLRYSILSVDIPQLLTLLLRKNYHFGCSGAPWRLGALGPGPPGPLDKMALPEDIKFELDDSEKYNKSVLRNYLFNTEH